ncbi:OmpA family protein [Sanguibacter sp. 4.1]|uniref:OmpA family protein n=1 Tax=Sanguibacter biliveldensis TaxID=3030830 RepID=A0AAF0Z4F6_9MICO|nr:OmpA family protein [Sanguibacter sp. 4.1]WPF82647.1 OmpA family protein [Sanguibacter sp. 4.1]
MTSTTVLTTLRGTCAALALAVLLTGCQADSDRTATPVPAASATTAAAPTPDPTDEPSTDPADDQTTDPASSTTAVAGYAPGEIPPVPLITIPDLSMLDASLSGFTHEITELVGGYPGLTVAPASCDVSGTVRSGAGSILLYGDGSGVYTGPDGTTVNYGDGSGTYVVDGVSVTVYGDGSGVFASGDVSVSNYGDGSGVYADAEVSLAVYGDGSGTRTDSTGTITNYGDGGGVFAGADGVTITNYGDGSGLYSDGSVTIQNDGQGTATVNGVPVPADPVPPVPAMGVFPPMGTIEPITSCGTTISLSDAALFDFGTSDLRPESEQTLDSLAAALAETGAPTLQIGGHTDSISDEAFNQQLSEDRAQAVADALVERGVTTTLETTGYGETRPVAPETTADGSDNPAGRQLNRRVEIFVPTF